MLTLATLLTALPELRYDVEPEGDSACPVVGVWPVGDEPPPNGWRNVLAVVEDTPWPPAAQTSVPGVAALAQAGAAALVIASPAPAPLLEAARQQHLPVLTSRSGRVSLPRLAQVVSDLRYGEEAAQARQLHLFLEHAQQLTSDQSTADSVLQWLRAAVQGHAFIVYPFERGDPVFDVNVPGPVLHDLISGVGQSAAISEDGWSLRMYGLGPASPHPVLVVARQGDWPASVNESVAQTASLLSWWLSLRAEGSQAMESIRASLLQMLMNGQVSAARRAALPLQISPSVMTAEGTQIIVYVLDGPPDDRQDVVRWAHHWLGADGLVSPCPVDPRQVIVVGTNEESLQKNLQDLVNCNSSLFIGASQPVTLNTVNEGHAQATRALATARSSPSQFATFTPEVSVVQLLPREPAHRWAADLLAPLDDWDDGRRDRSEWLATVQDWLVCGTTGTARLSGMHRNTVEKRVSAISSALKLDLSNIVDRLRLDLALRIDALHDGAAPEPGPVPQSSDLFADDTMKRWAHDYLNRLKPDLRETLRVWILANLQTAPAAERLGIGPRTVRARLRRAAAELQQPLIPEPRGEKHSRVGNGLQGPHDLALAFHITGELGEPRLDP